MKKLCFLFFSIVILCSVELISVNLKLEQKWIVNTSEQVIIGGSGGSSIDEDNFLYIPDIKMSNIKIFSHNGKLISVFGRRGLGPDEFLRPMDSFIWKNEIVITDFGRKKYFLYLIKKEKTLQILSEGKTNTVYDVCMDVESIYFSGYRIIDDKEFGLYSINKKNKEIRGHILLKTKFSSIGKLHYSRKNIPKFASVGLMGYCSIYKNNLYYIWEGDLKVFKINLINNKYSSFGVKTKNYVKPFISKKMKKGIFEKNWKIQLKEREKMSHIDKIMTNSKYVIVSYLTPYKSFNRRIRFLQIYNHQGVILKEIIAPENIRFSNEDEGVDFSLKKNILYGFRRFTDENGEESHEVLKYKII